MFIMLMLAAVLSVTQLLAQTKTITGKVTDDKKNPISNASIIVKGEKSGAQTNEDGLFKIIVEPSAKFLMISSVGFETKQIAIGNQTELQVELKSTTEDVGAVVTTGYITKKQPTISTSEVKAKDIQAVPLANVNDILQGKATGVQISSGSGQPGSAQSVRIHGTGSISAGSDPLYVIDGIIVASGQLAVRDQQQTSDILSNLNPDDIENITVLKDAAALALYGARGSNGVIVITTKKGKAGTSQISFRTQYGIVTPSFGNWKMMNGQQVYNYERAVEKVNGISDAQINIDYPTSLLNRTFDWVNAAFRQAQTQNYELAVSGGSEKTRHYISLGYFDQEGTLIGSRFKRVSSQINIDHTVNSRLKIGVNANLSFSNTDNAGVGALYSSPLFASMSNSPLFLNPYAPDGTLYKGNEPGFANFAVAKDNFLYSIYRNFTRRDQFRAFGKLYGNLKITDWLSINQNIGLDLVYMHDKIYRDPTTLDGRNDADPSKSGIITEILNYPTTITSQTSLTGAFKLNAKNNFDYLLLTEYQKNTFPTFSAEGRGLSTDKLKELNVVAEPATVGGLENKTAFISYLAQLNYTYNSKYSFSGSVRRDGSSRFGINKRYATFLSFGSAWKMIDEPFMKNQKVFSDFKMRFSYGTSGNADFRDVDGLTPLNYVAQALYDYSASYNGAPASVPLTIGNPNLTWEKSRQGNLGFDMAFLKGRIKTTIDAYQRITTDLLQNVPISSTSGFTTAQRNIGKLENRGIDFSLSTINIQSKSITWSTDLNISYSVNKVRETFNDQDIITLPNIIRVGKPINSWYTRQWAGVDPANGDPLWYDKNGNKTNNSGLADRRVLGTPYPKYTMGLGNTVNYKNFSLSFMFYGVTGNTIWNAAKQNYDADGARFGTNYSVDAGKNFWTTPGQIADRPKPVIGGNNNSTANSSRYYEDGSYLRLRNVTLSYSFPASSFKKIGLNSARVYITGINLLTITKYTGIDPEVAVDGQEFYKYPVSKSITFGLDVNF